MSYIFFWQVKITPHVSGSVNPVWDSVVEFLVKDFTKVRDKHFSVREYLPDRVMTNFSKKTCIFIVVKREVFVVFSDQRLLFGV